MYNVHSISHSVCVRRASETALNVFITELIRAVYVKNPSTLPLKEK